MCRLLSELWGVSVMLDWLELLEGCYPAIPNQGDLAIMDDGVYLWLEDEWRFMEIRDVCPNCGTPL